MADNMQKIKLLKLYEYLREKTDEEHPVSRADLCAVLNGLGISSNVRTLSLDIETLVDNGYEIVSFLRGRERFYYIPERELSVPEIKILIDAVEAASFVTEKKTRELVGKVAALAGKHRADVLRSNLVCFNTRKHTNEAVLYTVDAIEDAIIRKKKLSFNYFHLNEKGGRVFTDDGTGHRKYYYVEPVALVFNEDNYYLVGYSKKHPGTTASYRVDRMEYVRVVEESFRSEEAEKMVEGVAAFTGAAFKMFAGEPADVVLRFDAPLIEAVFDKFGEDTPVEPEGDDLLKARVRVQVSPTFFGWAAQFADRMEILAPESVAKRYREHIGRIRGV